MIGTLLAANKGRSGDCLVMPRVDLESHWTTIKSRLKQRFAQLTDDDLALADGKGEEVLGRLQQKLKVSSDELDGIIRESTQGTRKLEIEDEKADDFAGHPRAKTAEIAGDVRVNAADVARELRYAATQIGEDLRDRLCQRTRDFMESGEEYVRKKPREALLSSFIAGFVAGFFAYRQ